MWVICYPVIWVAPKSCAWVERCQSSLRDCLHPNNIPSFLCLYEKLVDVSKRFFLFDKHWDKLRAWIMGRIKTSWILNTLNAQKTDRLINGCTDRQIDRHANRQTDTQTYGQSQEAIIPPKKLSEQIACLIFFLNGYKFSLMSWLKTAIKLSWKLCSIKNHFQFEEGKLLTLNRFSNA